LLLPLLFSKSDIREKELHVHGTDGDMVAVLERNDRALWTKLALMMQSVVTEDFDLELSIFEVVENPSMTA
jgi:hypothetical protein